MNDAGQETDPQRWMFDYHEMLALIMTVAIISSIK